MSNTLITSIKIILLKNVAVIILLFLFYMIYSLYILHTSIVIL